MLADQQQHWNQKHGRGEHEQYGFRPTDFAQEVVAQLEPEQKILELGCGVGHDSQFLVEEGHHVLATDFSDIVIRQNKAKTDGDNPDFQVLDMSQLPWQFGDNSFDVVYAHLSLHYFTAGTTQQIFNEISRILKINGQLFFVCKSIKDHYYGKGEELQPDMFKFKGHVRHLFSKDFAESLLESNFQINKLEYSTNDFFGKKSGFLRCWATAQTQDEKLT